MAAEPEITPGMTARDWYDDGYKVGESGLAYESGPHHQAPAVIEQWSSGWHAGAAAREALGEYA